MKNKSFQYPFPTLDDKMFDGNKDGKLDAFETMFRDAHLNEMEKKVSDDMDNDKISTPYHPDDSSDRNYEVNPESSGYVILISFVSIVFFIIAFACLFSEDKTVGWIMFFLFSVIGAIILFGGINKRK